MKLRYLQLGIIFSFFFACDKDSSLEKKIAAINVDLNIERFDREFSKASPKNLSQLKLAYPFFFAEHIPDSVWHQKFKDTLQQQMFVEAEQVFNKYSEIEEDVKHLLQHIKYYDKTFNIPRVITIADNVDYRNKIVVNRDFIIINLLNYLGEDHIFYQNISKYISANMNANQIIPDIADIYAKSFAYQSKQKTFLEEMIYYGKLLYFKDIMIPEYTDAQKLGYTEQQLQWAQSNEEMIWRYFVERELLFDTDTKLFSRFIANSPYSKFYLELDNESPGRLGQYMGWQIVRAYAKKTGADVLKVMQIDAEEIFNDSKYKPQR